ncbi:MAG: hypothetical protein [Caudoviricetes sp.]|nr:MAG: hypothetical protein [Caudoviricetes sp.]
MKTITSRTEKKLADIKSEIVQVEAKLKADFLYNFKWGYGEQLYVWKGLEIKVTSFLGFLKTNPIIELEPYLEEMVKLITETLIGSVMKQKGNDSHAVAESLDLQVLKLTTDFYKILLECINEGETLN